MGIIGIGGGAAILLAFSIGNVEPAVPTMKVPGAYPYDETARVPAPPAVSESSVLPTPAPFPYQEPSSSSLSSVKASDSRTGHSRRPLSVKAVREVAFKYNGVPHFFGFLATLPANVSVVDPKLGKTRELVKGGHVIPKNVTWLRKHKQAPSTVANQSPKPTGRIFARSERTGAHNSGI